jgi:transcriptional regulator with XRE-family HTH domain
VTGPLEGLGLAIRAMRDEQRLSQRALARRASLSPGALSRIESGENNPSADTLSRVLVGLGKDLLDLHYALTGEPRPPAPPDPSPEAEFLRTSAREAIEALKYIAMHGTVEGSDAGGTEGRGNGGTVPARGSAGHDRPREQSPGRPPAKAR